jgi:integrase
MATITKRKTGWSVQIRRKGYSSQTRTLATKGEAQMWAREQESRIDRAQAPVNLKLLKATTLGDILRRYLLEVTPLKRSKETEVLRLTKFLRDQPMANLPLSDLTPSLFARYRDERLATVKPGTIIREMGLLRHALEVAKKDWNIVLTDNPVDGVRLPVAYNARDRRLQAGEYDRLEVALNRTRNPLIAPAIRFAIHTGMRRGEILGLRWEHVRLAERTAHIPDTKTGVPRTIPLTEAALAVLETRDGQHVTGPVFPLSMEALKQGWERVRQRAGLGDLHFHDLRHEAISRFCEMGLSVPEVALISGHKDMRMLFRYVNLRPSDLARKLAGRVWESAT